MKTEIKRSDFPDTPDGQHRYEMQVYISTLADTPNKSTFYNHLRGIIEYILLQPLEDRKDLEKEIIDNINELHHTNNYEPRN